MTITETVPLWLDCDPGNDDVFAILLCVYHPRINLLGISTVHGNAPVSSTTKNALSVLEVINAGNVPVYRGAEKPLVNKPKYAEHIHGKGGMGGIVLPEPLISEATDMDYIEALRQAILSHSGEIVIVCTGTMTNLSHLITKHPELIPKIRFVAAMGGGIEKGNITKYAEFNFNADPHAAKHVVNKLGNKLILAPLNITHTAVANEEVRRRIYEPNTDHDSAARKFFLDVILSFYKNYKISYADISGPPVHDPLAVYLALAFIDLPYDQSYQFRYLRRKLDVVDEGERSGESVVIHKDIDPAHDEEDGTYIGVSVDIDLFWACIFDALEAADRNQLKK